MRSTSHSSESPAPRRRPPRARTDAAKRSVSPIAQLEHDDVRLCSCTVEDDVTTVRGDVEVADDGLTAKIGQLTLAAGREVDEPELLVRDVSLQHDQHVVVVEKRE